MVHVSVYIPENLSSSEKEMMTKMGKSDNFQPNKSVKNKIFNAFKHFFD